MTGPLAAVAIACLLFLTGRVTTSARTATTLFLLVAALRPAGLARALAAGGWLRWVAC